MMTIVTLVAGVCSVVFIAGLMFFIVMSVASAISLTVKRWYGGSVVGSVVALLMLISFITVFCIEVGGAIFHGTSILLA